VHCWASCIRVRCTSPRTDSHHFYILLSCCKFVDWLGHQIHLKIRWVCHFILCSVYLKNVVISIFRIIAVFHWQNQLKGWSDLSVLMGSLCTLDYSLFGFVSHKCICLVEETWFGFKERPRVHNTWILTLCLPEEFWILPCDQQRKQSSYILWYYFSCPRNNGRNRASMKLMFMKILVTLYRLNR
jgi:hypothetical protein